MPNRSRLKNKLPKARFSAAQKPNGNKSSIRSTDREQVAPTPKAMNGKSVGETYAYLGNISDEKSSDDDWLDSGSAWRARLEARMDDKRSSSAPPVLAPVKNGVGELKANGAKVKARQGRRSTPKIKQGYSGLKKLTPKQIAQDLPSTPRGCEWRRSDDGLNLWRYWTDWNEDKSQRIKKTRYAGHLSADAWRIMKEYDHEAFISTVGERLRRHGGR